MLLGKALDSYGAFLITVELAYSELSEKIDNILKGGGVGGDNQRWTATLLAQVVECGRSRVQAPDGTNIQSLNITKEDVLPLLRHLQMVRNSSLFG